MQSELVALVPRGEGDEPFEVYAESVDKRTLELLLSYNHGAEQKQESTMNFKASFEAFLWGIVVAMGARIGWGLVSFLIDLAAKAIHS